MTSGCGRSRPTTSWKAKDYESLIIHYNGGAALRLKDVAKVSDGVEDRYNSGFFNDDAAVLLVINRQAGANIIETVNEIKAQLPALQAVLPASVKLNSPWTVRR